MSNIVIGACRKMAKVLFVICIIFCLITMGIAVANRFISDTNVLNNLLGLQYIFFGMFETFFSSVFASFGQLSGTLFYLVNIGIPLILSIIFIWAISDLSETNKQEQAEVTQSRKKRLLLITSLALLLFGIISLIVLIVNQKNIGETINSLNLIYLQWGKGLSFNVIILINIVFISVFNVVISLLVLSILLKNKQGLNGKQINSSVNFYSSVFEQPAAKEQIKNNAILETDTPEAKNHEDIGEKKGPNPLIEKIMQLNTLKDNEEISDVQYTKLRKKAIRRYKQQ